MTEKPSVSLIIVSRKRRASLRRTLSSLRFQSYENFEVIVVSDALDGSFYADLPFAENIRHVHFDKPNISAARNKGLAISAGDIIAFCDDDAVPDPCWIERLIAPFSVVSVGSAGGFVRGRNGIEYQWQGVLSDQFGDDFPVDIPLEDDFFIVHFDGQKYAKLQGTNCAFRRDALEKINGFDEGFRFFLDETDVCLRLAQEGYDSAFVPWAQVHHGFEKSEHRSASRAPKSLFDIGRSKRLFWSKHAADFDVMPSLEFLKKDQRNRLIRLMNDGFLEPRDVNRLMQTLSSGLDSDVETIQPENIFVAQKTLHTFGHSAPVTFQIIGGSTLSRVKLRAKAQESVLKGFCSLVLIFSITSLFHRRYYDERGFWVQTGGLFGKSTRSDPVFQFRKIRGRVLSEYMRMKMIFPTTEVYSKKLFREFILEDTSKVVKN